ncbi:glutamyl-tRNA amidotransferase subunit E, putative [Babesia ovata]|uniref:Glutamyl-tRNA amidotransferase subunit E, putative n=1 Tax=Babesia ovata TaxID=189622 RepID=A0A2H6KEF8_9APIC|nr:glutamyl-tRNA amidotransferase subunit E, putative [Babesia ovata]GBE61376.1 glutamyl-tRNA amidotransferase subunit E, putative [Babesia ovata]
MKSYTAHLAGIVLVAHSIFPAMARINVSHSSTMAPSFLVSESDIERVDRMAGVVLAEMSNLHDDVIDAVAQRMLSFLETQGLNYEDPEHINTIISLMETVNETQPGQKKGSKFLDELKQMAIKAWHTTKKAAASTVKELLLRCIKEFLKVGVRQALPPLAKINEKAMLALPLNIRVALSPIAYNMWLNLFRRAKLAIPADFKIESFVCKNNSKEKCDEIIKQVKDSLSQMNKKPVKEIDDIETGDDNDTFDFDEEDKRAKPAKRKSEKNL